MECVECREICLRAQMLAEIARNEETREMYQLYLALTEEYANLLDRTLRAERQLERIRDFVRKEETAWQKEKNLPRDSGR